MKVRQVEYSKLETGPGYNNEKFGVVVELEDGDTEESAMRYAKGVVECHFDEGKERQKIYEEINQAEWRVSELYRETARRKADVERIKTFESKIRERLGLPEPEYDDVPF